MGASVATRQRPAESDTTANKYGRAGEALSVSDDHFRGLVESTDDWVWEMDVNSIYTRASPRVKKLLNYAPEEVIGRTPMDFMPAYEARRIASQFQTRVESPLVGKWKRHQIANRFTTA